MDVERGKAWPMATIEFTLNGTAVSTEARDDETLLDVLRERLGLTSTWLESIEPEPEEPPQLSHQYEADVDVVGIDPSVDLYGGGGLMSTCRDIASSAVQSGSADRMSSGQSSTVAMAHSAAPTVMLINGPCAVNMTPKTTSTRMPPT